MLRLICVMSMLCVGMVARAQEVAGRGLGILLTTGDGAGPGGPRGRCACAWRRVCDGSTSGWAS